MGNKNRQPAVIVRCHNCGTTRLLEACPQVLSTALLVNRDSYRHCPSALVHACPNCYSDELEEVNDNKER